MKATSLLRRAGTTAGLVLLLASTSFAAESGWTPDAWITAKAKLALITDGKVSASDVNVDTVDGRVTLHGKVPTAEAKNAAQAAVKDISGVREVVNLLQVVSPAEEKFVKVSDDEVKKNVENALKANSSLRDSNIEVQSVNDGVVLLSGKADDLADHLEAVRVASAVPGVRRVGSEIQAPDRMASADEPEGAADKAGKAVSGAGHAVKEGTQNAADAVRSAAEKTGDTLGGAGSTISSTASDAWITTKVKSKLLASADAPALDVNVDTSGGQVTLFGTVDSQAAKAAAEKEATGTDGVKHVRNLLQVVPKAEEKAVSRKDDEIEKQVEQQLGNRKQFGDSDIDVEAHDGVVRLTGTAPSSSIRLSAAVVARRVDGVRAVTNDIEIEKQAKGG